MLMSLNLSMILRLIKFINEYETGRYDLHLELVRFI